MPELAFWQTLVFFILLAFLIGYTVLDGMDLGVGMLLPWLAKTEEEKRTLFNAIWPFWDGNEVWLIMAGGLLFAVFPPVYATVLSGFYLPVMFLLLAISVRAASFEFWPNDRPRKKFWETAFILCSLVIPLILGVAAGNLVAGVPLDAAGDYAGTYALLARPFPVFLALFGLSVILLQGAAYAAVKTGGELGRRALRAARGLWVGAAAGFAVFSVWGVTLNPGNPGWFWACGGLAAAALILIPVFIRRALAGGLLASSSVLIAALWLQLASWHFPYLVRGQGLGQAGLTVFNSSSTLLPLKIMSGFALAGLAGVIAFTWVVYWIFRGKVPEEQKSQKPKDEN